MLGHKGICCTIGYIKENRITVGAIYFPEWLDVAEHKSSIGTALGQRLVLNGAIPRKHRSGNIGFFKSNVDPMLDEFLTSAVYGGPTLIKQWVIDPKEQMIPERWPSIELMFTEDRQTLKQWAQKAAQN